MLTEGFAVLVEELRVRSLQRPGQLSRFTLANVDLIALRMDPKKKLFVGRRPQLLRDLLRSNSARKNSARNGKQSNTTKSANVIKHETFPPEKAQRSPLLQYSASRPTSSLFGAVSQAVRFLLSQSSAFLSAAAESEISKASQFRSKD
jgi:hypothetical protein